MFERLTEHQNGRIYLKDTCKLGREKPLLFCKKCPAIDYDVQKRHCPMLQLVHRLAAYEDTGLSPEQVQELAKAKTEGRLVVLPCKVGDTVYAVYGYLNKSIGTAIVKQICVKDGEIRVVLNNSIEKIWGRSVFATREEAEKAIGGGRDG